VGEFFEYAVVVALALRFSSVAATGAATLVGGDLLTMLGLADFLHRHFAQCTTLL
jgi:hypothetical protein